MADVGNEFDSKPAPFEKPNPKGCATRLVEVLGRVTMQVFVREHCTMIAAPVQSDVDVIPKWSHYVSRNNRFDHSIDHQFTPGRRRCKTPSGREQLR